MSVRLSSARADLNPTKQQCEEWLKNKLVNPKTGRDIVKGGPTYLAFEEAAERFGLSAPKKVGHIAIPQSKRNWQSNDFTGKYFKNILVMKELGVLTENDYEAFPIYAQICTLGLENNIVPDDMISEVRMQLQRFGDIAQRVDVVTKARQEKYNQLTEKLNKYRPHMIDDELKKRLKELRLSLVRQVLLEGYSSETDAKFEELKAFIKLTIYERLIDEKEINIIKQQTALHELDEIKSIETSLQEIISTSEAYAKKPGVRSMSMKTKTPNFPSQMESREVVRNRIRLQPKLVAQIRTDSRGEKYTVHRPDPNEPPQFIEKVNINELKGTNRSQFKSYEKLEHMTPLTNEVLAALPEKKRTELLHELKAACNEMKDTITNTRFDRMRKKQLHLIVRLGDKPGKQRCYYVRSAYKMWQQATKKNIPFTNPETREKVTHREKEDILHKIKYVKPDAVDPEEDARNSLVKDPALEFDISIDNRYPDLALIRIIRKFGVSTYTVSDLGYVPVDIEVEHSGSADITSAVALYKIKELFKSGRLMRSNFIPYSCCRIHFKHSHYWNEPMPERVRKLTLMLEEINALL